MSYLGNYFGKTPTKIALLLVPAAVMRDLPQNHLAYRFLNLRWIRRALSEIGGVRAQVPALLRPRQRRDCGFADVWQSIKLN